MVFDLKKDANSQVVVNTLYKLTSLQTSFSVNNVALVKGKPMMLNMKDMPLSIRKSFRKVLISLLPEQLKEQFL
jgi:DNA gyrase/topoisomerase IV subunit A